MLKQVERGLTHISEQKNSNNNPLSPTDEKPDPKSLIVKTLFSPQMSSPIRPIALATRSIT